MAKIARVAGQILNREELAGLLGLSTTAVDAYVRAGCPVLQKGSGRRPYQFNSADVLAWRSRREEESRVASGDVTGNQIKQRYTLAQAELKEIQLAEKRGELVSISAVTATLADELTAVRGRLLAMPGRLAGALAIMSDPAEIEAAIDDEVRGALSELSSE